MTAADAGRAVIRPYGDTTGDGRIQVSFTLPLPSGTEDERALAEGAAAQLAAKMGLEPAMVVHAKAMGPDFTFFIVYGTVRHLVDLADVKVARREFPLLSAAEVNRRIRSALGRELVVVGATVGVDAHTVGIDAILNVKGHAGEKGLESYAEIRVVNLGAQVAVSDLVARAVAEGADAVLVSQVVTQRDAHILAARQIAEAFSEESGITRRWRASWAWTGCSAAARPPVRWPATWPTRWPPSLRETRHERGRSADRYPAPVRVRGRRTLRREPGGRRVRAGPVRGRGHRGVHPDGRR